VATDGLNPLCTEPFLHALDGSYEDDIGFVKTYIAMLQDNVCPAAWTSLLDFAHTYSLVPTTTTCAAANINPPPDQEDYDGTLLPTDFKKAGQIRDTELARLMVHPLPAGVVLHALFDSCHSGWFTGGMDLLSYPLPNTVSVLTTTCRCTHYRTPSAGRTSVICDGCSNARQQHFC